MEINIAEKRTWSSQRKVEADEIRRERKLIAEMDDYYKLRQEHAGWDACVVAGVILGVALLFCFTVVMKMAVMQ